MPRRRISLMFATVVAIAGALAVPGAAQAQDAADQPLPPGEVVVYAEDEGGNLYFEFEALEGEDPRVVLQPGEEYQFHVINRGNLPHSFHLGEPFSEETPILTAGQEAWLNVTAPADAAEAGEYWCTVHPEQMRGELAFAAMAEPTPAEPEPTEPAPEEDEPAVVEPTPEEVAGEEDAQDETPGPGLLMALAAGIAAVAVRSRRR